MKKLRRLGIMNVPNLMTGIRIVISWIAIGGMFHFYRKNEALHFGFCMLYCVGYIIDLFDGIVARRLNQESEFGAVFDPASDKIVANTVLLFLYVKGVMFWWVLLCVLFRDIVLSVLRLVCEKYELRFRTSKLGKLRTNVIGYGCGIVYLWHYALEPVSTYRSGHFLVHGMVIAVSVFAVLNLVFKRDAFLTGMFKTFEEKLFATLTLVVAGIYPYYSIPAAIAFITAGTLVDYGIEFKRTVEKEAKRLRLPDFLWKSTGQMLIAMFLSVGLIVMAKNTLSGAIVTANIVFFVLLFRNTVYLTKKEKPTTTSIVSCPARRTVK